MNIISNFFLKRDNFKYGYGYKNNRDDYYKQHNYILSNRLMSNLFVKSINLDIKFNTNADITPLNLKFGTYYYEIIRELGKPRYEINQGIGKNHTVLFYRKNIGDYNFLSQLHFYANQLIYVKSDFDYLRHGKDCRTAILSSLFHKYSIRCDYDFSNDIVIQDSDNNIITISDFGKISLQYFSGDEEMVNNIIDINIKNLSLAKKTEQEFVLMQSVV